MPVWGGPCKALTSYSQPSQRPCEVRQVLLDVREGLKAGIVEAMAMAGNTQTSQPAAACNGTSSFQNLVRLRYFAALSFNRQPESGLGLQQVLTCARAQIFICTNEPSYDRMNPESPHFCRKIYDTVFHYSARCEQGDRLKICISTPAMDEAAWKYGHESRIILDGTFGVCSSRMLLFIAMGIDKDGHGVPLAFFLFSAPTGALLHMQAIIGKAFACIRELALSSEMADLGITAKEH
ncbi:hypothetical protein C8R43DRAFT_961000 [Mycena crocata]|nr:hypothetical protein C8R43DRAFT_961000 [Mycena crocata]